jgi:hypothetical protein
MIAPEFVAVIALIFGCAGYVCGYLMGRMDFIEAKLKEKNK